MELLNHLFGKKQFQMVEVVELTNMEIFANSMAQVRALIQQDAIPALGSNPDIFKEEAWDLILELMVFSLHLADRIACGAVDPKKCSRFMNALLISVSSSFAAAFGCDAHEARQEFQLDFLSRYKHRSSFYDSLPLASGGGESPEGTLTWETAKGVASEFFPDHAARATIMLSITFGQCVHGLKDLRVRLLGVRDL